MRVSRFIRESTSTPKTIRCTVQTTTLDVHDIGRFSPPSKLEPKINYSQGRNPFEQTVNFPVVGSKK